jgi:dTDP-4-amino-4,6-dideoxygalactose transaminase
MREVVLSGNFVSGKKVAEFERQFASYIAVSGASAVNSGTAALHIGLAVLEIGPGDEVIVPSLTFMSTVTCVLHQNAIPVFADIDQDSFCISPEDIKKRITARTKAIIPVHLFGNSADMDEIMAIAREHGLYVIEDCAQAHGTEYKGKKVGSIGHMGAFSFFATKHMTTGEGGILTSNNSQWIEQSNIIRSLGMVNRDDHVVLGYNYRMNEMAAAMGLVQMEKLEPNNEKRIANSKRILAVLSGDGDKWYRVPPISGEIRHTYFWCPLIIRTEQGFKSKEVVARLRERGVEVRHRYCEPLYKQKLMLDLTPYPGGCPFTCIPSSGRHQDYKNLYLPNVESLAGNIIGLPNHAAMSDEDIEYVIKVVRELY